MAVESRTLPEVDPRRALQLVTEMMAIPGKSGEEGAVADYIQERLAEARVEGSAVSIDALPKRSPVGGAVGNVIARLPGTRRGPRRMLMAHIDTVPLCVGARPVRKGDLIESRDPHTALGADNRAGASVVLTAVLEILRQKLPHPPLTLFWPVQEEIGLYGARFVSLGALGNPRLCFNWDGGAPNIATIGATGDYNMEIEIAGRASHAGAHPERGVSAIGIAGRAIADLVDHGWHGLIVKDGRAGTSNIGFVHGGEATNVVTPHVALHAEARSHDPEFRREIVQAFRQAFAKAAASLRNDAGETGSVRFTAELKYESFRLAEEEPCVQAAKAAIAAVGLEPEARISNGGLDANWTTARGLPTVTLGCGQQDVHTVHESLHVPSFLHACRIGLLLATGS